MENEFHRDTSFAPWSAELIFLQLEDDIAFHDQQLSPDYLELKNNKRLPDVVIYIDNNGTILSN